MMVTTLLFKLPRLRLPHPHHPLRAHIHLLHFHNIYVRFNIFMKFARCECQSEVTVMGGREKEGAKKAQLSHC